MSGHHLETLTLDHLRSMLSYDAATGVFRWTARPWKRSRRRAGEIAGTMKRINDVDFRYIGIGGRSYLASRLAWFYVNGVWPASRLEFANGDPNDVRIENMAESATVIGVFDHATPEGRAAYLRAHRAANPAHYRAKDLLRDFGITAEEYGKLLADQSGVCAVCARPEIATRNGKLKHLAVDHDHLTGDIRGLLCADCNTGLGKFGDDPERLRRAARYLERKAAPQNVVALVPKEQA